MYFVSQTKSFFLSPKYNEDMVLKRRNKQSLQFAERRNISPPVTLPSWISFNCKYIWGFLQLKRWLLLWPTSLSPCTGPWVDRAKLYTAAWSLYIITLRQTNLFIAFFNFVNNKYWSFFLRSGFLALTRNVKNWVSKRNQIKKCGLMRRDCQNESFVVAFEMN